MQPPESKIVCCFRGIFKAVARPDCASVAVVRNSPSWLPDPYLWLLATVVRAIEKPFSGPFGDMMLPSLSPFRIWRKRLLQGILTRR
jgi:hypothetical protein